MNSWVITKRAIGIIDRLLARKLTSLFFRLLFFQNTEITIKNKAVLTL